MVKQYEEGWICPECGMTRKADGFDPCLGELPGVKFACCGHGNKRTDNGVGGYVYFDNGIIIYYDKLKEVVRL